MSRRSRRKTTVDSTKATLSLRRQTEPEANPTAEAEADMKHSAETLHHIGAIGPLQDGISACARSLGLTVRPASEADATSITQAHTRFEMEMAAWSTADGTAAHIPDGLAAGIRQIIQDEGGDRIMLLTRQLPDCSGGGEIIGFVYSCDEVVRSGTSCYIAEVFVEPSERGQGLGDLLVATALASALARGTSASHLYVCHRNTAAVQLYEKHGFKGDGDSGDPTHDLVMVNAAVSVDAVRNLLEQRQARQPRSRRRARSIKSATSDTSARTSRTGTSTDTGNTSGSLTHRGVESSANGVSARAARARARQRAEGKQTANSGTSRTVRQPCADLAENIARNRGLPVDQVQSDSIASSSADAEVPASVPVDAPKHKVWVRPRSECPASASVEQPAGNKKRRQTTTLQLSKTDSAASGSTMVVGDHKLRSLKQIHGAKLIALSGFGTQPERLQSLESMIIRLGGKISRKTGFDHKCTHVIVACDGIGSLRRTEKMLGALASGRPLLTEKFIDASDAAGTFVDENDFECREMFKSLLPRSRAPCFSQMCAVVLGAGDEKRFGLQRILQAGGAAIGPSDSAQPPLERTALYLGGSITSRQPVTHVIVPPGGEHDLNLSDARQLRQLQRQEGAQAATVIFHNDLVDFLTGSGSNQRAGIGLDV